VGFSRGLLIIDIEWFPNRDKRVMRRDLEMGRCGRRRSTGVLGSKMG